eukprot:8200378-Alexandrium_andersonii.AAC.1
MYEQYRPLRKSALAHSDWPMHARVQAGQALLYSRLLYNSGIWGALSREQMAHVRDAYMAPLRDITGMR